MNVNDSMETTVNVCVVQVSRYLETCNQKESVWGVSGF